MSAQHRRSRVPRMALVTLPVLVGLTAFMSVARADLDEYIKKPEPAFAWSQSGSATTPSGIVTNIKLTSQVWQGITWSHDLRVYEPREIVHPDAMLLFITGGDNERKASRRRPQARRSAWPRFAAPASPCYPRYPTSRCWTARPKTS